MERKIVIIGRILIIIGAILGVIGGWYLQNPPNLAQSYQNYKLCSNSSPNYSQCVLTAAQNVYKNMGWVLQLVEFGSFMIVVGIIIIIIGSRTKPGEKKGTELGKPAP